MYLREKLDELTVLNKKVVELKTNILINTSEDKDALVKELLIYYDDIQNIKLVLAKVNNQTMVNVGQTQIDIITAVTIRDNIKNKINLISDIIKSNATLDILTLLDQRDALLEEYNSINKSIRLSDWSIKLD